MGKSKMEEMELDMEEIVKPIEMVEVLPTAQQYAPTITTPKETAQMTNDLVSCLRNERVIVRHINKPSGLVDNPKHIFFGNIAPTAIKRFCVPKLSRTNSYVNVLTDSEKKFLEAYMGLEYNALSIYNKTNNYWKNRWVKLGKDDTVLDLSNPEQYIDYKILLANKDFICPSLQYYEDHPIKTYQYMIVSDKDYEKKEEENMSLTMRCYKAFGKIEDDADTMRVIIETMEGKPTATTSKLSFLKGRINTLIQQNPKMFIKLVSDEYLPTKVLIKKATEQHILTKRNDLYYYENQPLCEDGQNSTYNIAANYLNNPKHQQLKFTIEAKLK